MFLFSMTAVRATHITGMNVSYKHIGGDTLLIYADFYRYCGGTMFNNEIVLGLRSVELDPFKFIAKTMVGLGLFQ